MPSFTIDVIARGFVLMSTAWLVAFALRKRSASLRAGIWTVAFAALLALPAIARVTPAWKIAVFPAIETTAVDKSPAQVPVTTSVRYQPEQPVFEGRKSSEAHLSTAITTPPSVASFESEPDAPVSLSPVAVALSLWAGVALLLFARIAVNRIAAARLINRSASVAPSDFNWRNEVEVVRAELGISRPIRIRFTDAIAVPAVIGVWRPTLLLPIDAGAWTADARRVVILHELAHVARWDAFDQLVTEASCALYWILPPVWMAARSAAALREQATDDAVIRAGVRPSAYAAELIDLAQNIAGVQPGAASLAMAGSRIQDRVVAILDPSVRRGRVTVGGALALTLVAGLAVTTLAAVSPERQVVVPPPPPAPPATPAPPPAMPPMPPAEWPALPAEPAQFPPVPPMAPPPPPTPPTPMTLPAPMAPMAPMATTEMMAPMSPMVASTPLAAPAPPAPMSALPPLPPIGSGPAPLPPPQSPARGVSQSSSSSGPERSTLCPDGRDSFSNSSNNDGSHQTWSVKVSGKGCNVELKSEGKIEFNDDFTDVASITPSGYFRLTVNRAGRRQELDIDGRGTALTHTYRVDGSARNYDAAAKSWLGDFLVQLDRETAVGVDVRLPRLLRQGGVDGVLQETALMTSDYARSRYYGKLSRLVKLSSTETVRIMNQAASLGTQDYYAAELLKALGPQVGDSASERAALLAVIGKISADYYIVESVNAVFATRTVSRSDVDSLLRIVPRIKSGYYASEAVRSVLRHTSLDESDLVQLVSVVKPIQEDYYKSQALRAIVRHANATANVRQAVVDASAGMSTYYRDELLKFVRTP